MSYANIYYNGATIESLALSKSKAGNVQLIVQFHHENGDPPLYLSFSDAALPYTEEKLRNMGWDPVENGWDVDTLVENQSIVGNVVDLVCEEEDYNGKATIKVKFVNECGSRGAKEKLSSGEAKSFTAGLRSRLGVTGGANKAPPKKAAKPAEKTPF